MFSLTPLSGSCVTEPEHDSADCVPGERGCGQHLYGFSLLLISFEVVLNFMGACCKLLNHFNILPHFH